VTHTPAIAKLPPGVKAAATLFVLYGIAVLVSTAVALGGVGWATPRLWLRAIFRLVASSLVAWGLLRRARWAWIVGLALALAWLLLAALTTLVIERHDVYWLAPSRWQAGLVASLLCLGAIIALLASPSARAAFGSSDEGSHAGR
jgi:hypothetical protein